MKKLIILPIVLGLLVVLGGCVGYVRVPTSSVEVEEDAQIAFDDPAQGWFVEGYWTGGCLNCGVWISPFWTTDILILQNHFNHYHGHHRHDLDRHFKRHDDRDRGHRGPVIHKTPKHNQVPKVRNKPSPKKLDERK